MLRTATREVELKKLPQSSSTFLALKILPELLERTQIISNVFAIPGV
jgi:hypothetical protein